MILRLASFDDIEEAEGVEYSMIATKVGCALLVALSLIEVIFGIVDVRNLIRQRCDRYLLDWVAYVLQDFIEDLIP